MHESSLVFYICISPPVPERCCKRLLRAQAEGAWAPPTNHLLLPTPSILFITVAFGALGGPSPCPDPKATACFAYYAYFAYAEPLPSGKPVN